MHVQMPDSRKQQKNIDTLLVKTALSYVQLCAGRAAWRFLLVMLCGPPCLSQAQQQQ